MPLVKGSSNADVSRNVRELMSTGRDQRQSVAIALRVAGKSKETPGTKRIRVRKM